ncbi:MAG: rod-binding protein [Leptospiraceae bacterium]|nr:rod-binding protein [Leptospiraceae bacterium]MDW7976945.1 rod-binding protein [Leptospiraceae bacterium]
MKIEKPLHDYFPLLKESSNENQGKVASGKIYPYREESFYQNLPPKKKALYETALEFQSLFVKIMLNSMRKTLNPQNDLLYGGRVQEIFEDLLFDEYAKIYSKNTPLTIAKEIYHQYEKFVEEDGISSLKQELEKQKDLQKHLDKLQPEKDFLFEWKK